jgi:hypothetical protein
MQSKKAAIEIQKAMAIHPTDSSGSSLPVARIGKMT